MDTKIGVGGKKIYEAFVILHLATVLQPRLQELSYLTILLLSCFHAYAVNISLKTPFLFSSPPLAQIISLQSVKISILTATTN